MPQAITTADVHRGWFDCITCGEILPIFYHQRCPTCHSEFTLLAAQHEEQEGTDGVTYLKLLTHILKRTAKSNVFTSVCRTHLHT